MHGTQLTTWPLKAGNLPLPNLDAGDSWWFSDKCATAVILKGSSNPSSSTPSIYSPLFSHAFFQR
jgi:hypothetical protein